MYKVYTDGSYKASTNKGGYASIILNGDKAEKILHFGYYDTTNNRMELKGVLAALEYFLEPTTIEIYSDSAYIVNNYNGGHANLWIESNDLDKKNLDLWRKIIKLCEYHKVSFNWVKGHHNNIYNNLADLYANISAITINPQKDEI